MAKAAASIAPRMAATLALLASPVACATLHRVPDPTLPAPCGADLLGWDGLPSTRHSFVPECVVALRPVDNSAPFLTIRSNGYTLMFGQEAVLAALARVDFASDPLGEQILFDINSPSRATRLAIELAAPPSELAHAEARLLRPLVAMLLLGGNATLDGPAGAERPESLRLRTRLIYDADPRQRAERCDPRVAFRFESPEREPIVEVEACRVFAPEADDAL